MKNGIHPNVPRHEYDLLLDRVNYSTLKILGQQSPLHYKHAIDGRPTTLEQLEARLDTKQRDTLLGGEATHVAALEPEVYGGNDVEEALHVIEQPQLQASNESQGRYLVFKGTRDERHKRYQSALAKAALARAKLITEDMDRTARAIAKAVRSNPDVAPYIAGGHRELTVLWDYEEPQVAMIDGWSIAMRCRIDYLTDVAIIDLKSTYDASPDEFAKSMWNQGCFVQAAMQQDGVAAVTRRRRPYLWLAVEKTPPYACALYEPSHIGLEMGRNSYRDWLRKLHVCQERHDKGEPNAWPGYTDGVAMQLDPPRWAMPREEYAA
jgi:hypothetical protein